MTNLMTTGQFAKIGVLLFIATFQRLHAQITLTHNVGNTPITTDMTSCEREEYWARTFTLSEFGISTTEQFIIKSGKVAVSNSFEGARVIFNIFSIDADFPATKPRILGYGQLAYAPEIGDMPEIVPINFATPVVVPAGIQRILVEVTQGDDPYNADFKKFKIAGTPFDNDVSWFKGCRKYYSHIATEDLIPSVPNANFLINVTGEKMSILNGDGTVLLNPGLGDTPIKTRQYACTGGGLKYAKTFLLEDFGVPKDKEYIINSGQVAFSQVGVYDTKIQFNIYRIDSNFPSSHSAANLLGSSQVVGINYYSNPPDPRIFNVDFETPIVVPAGTERIMVEVFNLGCRGYSCYVFMAGIEQSRGLSWIESANGGCPPFGGYKSTEEIGRPEINYFIRTKGEVRSPFPFQLDIDNDCSEDTFRSFNLDKQEDINSIRWNFGDSASGTDNVSTDITPSHSYTDTGEYLLSVDIMGKDGKDYRLEKRIHVSGPPEVERPMDLIVCEDIPRSGISSAFSTESIHDFILKGRNDIDITYFDGNGVKLPNPLPRLLTNSIPEKETITVRVAYKNRPSCYSETFLNLLVNPLPVVDVVTQLVQCADAAGGFAMFSLKDLKTDLSSKNPDAEINFYHDDKSEIVNLEEVRNKVEFEEKITILVTFKYTDCAYKTQIKLVVKPLPIVPDLPPFTACDENGDGISEYFDTSGLFSKLVGIQERITVSYFDESGTKLSDTFPDRFTNTIPYEETITARLTDIVTGCMSQTTLIFKTSDKPQIGILKPFFACDEGEGKGSFDTSQIEKQLIGDQQGLNVFYFDSDGNGLPSPLPAWFRNTESWNQTINIRVENARNKSCYSETTLTLKVNESPSIDLQKTYFLCNLKPSLKIDVASDLDSYAWRNEKGEVISESFDVEIFEGGTYSLTVARSVNDLYCESSWEFDLVRSMPPNITEVRFQELSDNNIIEIEATGDGDFEYSLDGVTFQENRLFEKVIGGVYTVFIRDKNGCGEAFKEITLLDYPKFFTPNNDGTNDLWNIMGIAGFPLCKVYIFDRYGKMIAQLDSNSTGWNGEYLNTKLPSSDYWFRAHLGNGKEFAGHFTLKR